MTSRPPCTLGVALCILVSGARGAEAPSVAQAVRTAASRPHPRLILTGTLVKDLRERMKADPAMARYFASLRKDADKLLSRPARTRKKTGRRLLGVSRDVLSRVLRLAVVYRFTGERRYLKRAEKEMLAAAEFTDWNPSHYLDVAEMSTALALGYDWLYNDLPAASRDRILNALVSKGLKTYKGKGGTNNWNDVCNGGMLMTALAVAESHPDLAVTTAEKALSLLPRALGSYTANGGHMEGPGWYWNYANLYAVPAIACLESACGTDLGLVRRFGGFMAGPRFFLHMHGPTGRYFNYSDSGQGKPYLSPPVFWFAARLNAPDLLWFQAKRLRASRKSGRFGPMVLLWWPRNFDIPAPARAHYQADGITPVATHRSSWTDPNASFIGFKGGRGGGPHGHMDIGSFIFESDSVRWAIDLGAQSYHSLESRGISLWGKTQGAQRWKVFRLNNFSHSTLVVNGALQRVSGKSVFTRKAANHTVMDFASLYTPHLAKASRGVRLLPGRQAVIQDELTAGGKKATVRWAMLTGAKVRIDGSRATLTQDGKTLRLSVQSPAAVELEIYQTDPPPNDYDCRNPNTRMVGFSVTLKPGESTRLTVLLTPGSQASPAKVPITPLAAWKK